MNYRAIIGVVLSLLSVATAATIVEQQPPNNDPVAIEEAHPIVEVKTQVVRESIPFTEKTVYDNTLAKGTSKITTYGKNGIKAITYQITYTDGVETSKTAVKETIVEQPVAQVIHVGTYEPPRQQSYQQCANGTYVNSYGNTVCRPSYQNTGGATAICGDGTYSYSQHRQGTCSHHGGVSRWL